MPPPGASGALQVHPVYLGHRCFAAALDALPKLGLLLEACKPVQTLL